MAWCRAPVVPPGAEHAFSAELPAASAASVPLHQVRGSSLASRGAGAGGRGRCTAPVSSLGHAAPYPSHLFSPPPPPREAGPSHGLAPAPPRLALLTAGGSGASESRCAESAPPCFGAGGGAGEAGGSNRRARGGGGARAVGGGRGAAGSRRGAAASPAPEVRGSERGGWLRRRAGHAPRPGRGPSCGAGDARTHGP